MPLQYFQMILKQIMYQLINYVAWKKKKNSQFELCKVCINNNICNDRCKMSNYIIQYENNMCMYTSMGQYCKRVNWIMYL